MPVTEIRPVSTLDSSGWGTWTLVGAASFDAALRDNSNSSYLQQLEFDGDWNPLVTLGFVDPGGWPAGMRIQSVLPRIIGRRSSVGDSYIGVTIDDTAKGSPQDSQLSPTADGVWYSVAGPYFSRNCAGDDWSPADLATTVVYIQGVQNVDTLNLYVSELFLDITYLRKGSVTVADFAYGATATTKPTVTWTVTSPDQPTTPQAKWLVRIYTADVFSASGFDPLDWANFEAIYDSAAAGTSMNNASTRAHTVTESLPQNEVLRVYVYAAQPWTGSAGDWWAYDYTDVTVSLEPLATPQVSAVAVDDQSVINVAVTSEMNLIGGWPSGLEYSPPESFTNSFGFICVFGTNPGMYDFTSTLSTLCVAKRSQIFTPGAGNTALVLSMTALSRDVSVPVNIDVEFFDPDGNSLSYLSFTSSALPVGTPVRLGPITFTTPVGVGYAQMIFSATPGSAGKRFELSEIQHSYIDGWASSANLRGLDVIDPSHWGFPRRYGRSALLLSSAAAGDMAAVGWEFTHAVAGQTYSAIASFLPGGGPGRQVAVGISFFDAGHAFISGSYGAYVNEVMGTWQDATQTVVAPAGAAYMKPSVLVHSAAGGAELHLVDGIGIVNGSSVVYGAGGWTAEWTPTPTVSVEVQSSLEGTAWSSVYIAPDQAAAISAAAASTGDIVATIPDRAPHRGVPAYYRARVHASAPLLGDNTSDWSPTVATTLKVLTAWLKCPTQPDLDMAVKQAPPFVPVEPLPAAVFDDIIGRRTPVVMTDSPTKAFKFDLTLYADGNDERKALRALLTSRKVLLFCDTIGRQWYCLVAGDLRYDLARATPVDGRDDMFPIRPWNTITIPMVEVQGIYRDQLPA